MSSFSASVINNANLATTAQFKKSNPLLDSLKDKPVSYTNLSSYPNLSLLRRGKTQRFASLNGYQQIVQPSSFLDVNNAVTAKEYSKDVADVLRASRDDEPAHYFFKIDSFSTLVEQNMNKLESNDFEVDGFKWRLCLYPNGNKEANGSGNISLYLVIRGTDKFPRDWKLNVHFKLFVYNHLQENYLTIQDVGVKTRRLSAMKTECGFSQLLSLDTFNDKSNGYLFKDSCIFGAEVSVIKYSGIGECISWIKEPRKKCFTWKVFSSITCPDLFSDEFTVEDQKWKLRIYPKGYGDGKGEWLSFFLYVSSPLKHRIYVKYMLRLKDQISNKHYEKEVDHWFSPESHDYYSGWGYSQFMKLSDVKEMSRGHILNNTLILEVEFLVVTVTKSAFLISK